MQSPLTLAEFCANIPTKEQRDIHNVYSYPPGNSQALGSRETRLRGTSIDIVCLFTSEDTMVPTARIIAKWSQVAQKFSHSTLTYNVVSFAETEVEISNSSGNSIYQHLLLKVLIFDPITQNIMENEPYEWNSDENSDSSQQDDPLDTDIAHQSSLDSNPLMDILGSGTNLASLLVEVAAFAAEVTAFVQ
jgi:hypothetical protein